MAVATVVGVERLPWGGSQERGLPSSIWRAVGQSTSDASAGANSLTFRFSLLGEPIAALLYSLEQIAIAVQSSAADITGQMTSTMGWRPAEFGGLAEFIHRYTFTIFHDPTNLVAGLRPIDTHSIPPTILGGPHAEAPVDARVRVSIPNVDTERLDVFMMGYVWDQLAISSPGGPRRPENGLFDR